VSLKEASFPTPPPNQDDPLAVDEALTRLASKEPTAVEVVKLHFHAGPSIKEAAAALEVSRATAYWHCTYARAEPDGKSVDKSVIRHELEVVGYGQGCGGAASESLEGARSN
jgi:hypothetical protein